MFELVVTIITRHSNPEISETTLLQAKNVVNSKYKSLNM